MGGLLGTGASFKSDINLLIQLSMGGLLLFGMMLARRRNYRAHAICQASVMGLNLIMIASIMLPAFRHGVGPGLPGGLKDSYYWVSTLHASLGTIAQILGSYIVVRAGTRWLPEALCFQNYKLWMRTELALWWSVIVLGVVTYDLWL